MELSNELIYTVLGIVVVNLFVWYRVVYRAKTADTPVIDASGQSSAATKPSTPSEVSKPNPTKAESKESVPAVSRGSDNAATGSVSSAASTTAAPAPAPVSSTPLETKSTPSKLSRRDRYLQRVSKTSNSSTPTTSADNPATQSTKSNPPPAPADTEDSAKSTQRPMSAREKYLAGRRKKATAKSTNNTEAQAVGTDHATPSSSKKPLSKREQYLRRQQQKANSSSNNGAGQAKEMQAQPLSSPAVEEETAATNVAPTPTTSQTSESNQLPNEQPAVVPSSPQKRAGVSVEGALDRQFPTRQRSRLSYLKRSNAATKTADYEQASVASTHVAPAQNQTYDSLLLQRARQKKRQSTAPSTSHISDDANSTRSTRDRYFSKSAPTLSKKAGAPLHLQPENVKTARRQQLLQSALQKQQQKFVARQVTFRQACSQGIPTGSGAQTTEAAPSVDATDALLDDIDIDDLMADFDDEEDQEAGNSAKVPASEQLDKILSTTFSESQRSTLSTLLPQVAGNESSAQLECVLGISCACATRCL